MSSASFNSVTSLHYSDVSRPPSLGAHLDAPDSIDSVPAGVPEVEVERRIIAACAAERATVEQQLRQRAELREAELRTRINETIRRFADERSAYFVQVEHELVQLALAIARKILAREAQLDPMLLTGLVRIALDGMQCGPVARLRVAPDQASTWQACAADLSAHHRTEIIADVCFEDALFHGE